MEKHHQWNDDDVHARRILFFFLSFCSDFLRAASSSSNWCYCCCCVIALCVASYLVFISLSSRQVGATQTNWSTYVCVAYSLTRMHKTCQHVKNHSGRFYSCRAVPCHAMPFSRRLDVLDTWTVYSLVIRFVALFVSLRLMLFTRRNKMHDYRNYSGVQRSPCVAFFFFVWSVCWKWKLCEGFRPLVVKSHYTIEYLLWNRGYFFVYFFCDNTMGDWLWTEPMQALIEVTTSNQKNTNENDILENVRIL